MSTRRIYLDWNATAPLRPQARAAMLAALDEMGNPSSAHAEGRRARALVETARRQVAALVNARPEQVVFTSGATEANATALAGDWDAIAYASVEHASVLEPAQAAIGTSIELPVDGKGIVATTAIAQARETHPSGRGLAAVQLANNETGIVQPVAQISAFARESGIMLHCDAVQAAGRMPIDVEALGVATLSLSAHKIGGPKGIGALIVRDDTGYRPLVRGGGQERSRRAGTEAVALIAGFGAAAQAAGAELDRMPAVQVLRDRLEAGVLELAPDAVIVGQGTQRLANTSCIALKGRRAETLVIGLDLAGIAVGAGSACSSGKMASSHVLAAMSIAPDIAGSAIRISIGTTTTIEDIDACLDALRRITSAVRAA